MNDAADEAQAALQSVMDIMAAPVIDYDGVVVRPDVPAGLQDPDGNPFVMIQGILAKRSDSALSKGNRKPRFFVLCPEQWGFFHFDDEARIDAAGYMHGRCSLDRLKKFSTDGAAVPLKHVTSVEYTEGEIQLRVHFTPAEGSTVAVVDVLAPSSKAASVWASSLQTWSAYAKSQAEEERSLQGTTAPPQGQDTVGELPESPTRSPTKLRNRRGSMLGRIRASMFGDDEDGGVPAAAGPPSAASVAAPAAPPQEDTAEAPSTSPGDAPRPRRRSVVGPPPTPPTSSEAPSAPEGDGPSSPQGEGVMGRAKRRGSLLLTGASRRLLGGGDETDEEKRAKAKAAKARAEQSAKEAFLRAQQQRLEAEQAAAAQARLDDSYVVFAWPYIKVYDSLEEAERAAAAKKARKTGTGRGTGQKLELTFNEQVPETLPVGGGPEPALGLHAWAVPVPKGDPRVGVDLKTQAGEAFWRDSSKNPIGILHGYMGKFDRTGVTGQERARYFVLTPYSLLYFHEASHAGLGTDGYVTGRAAGSNTNRFLGIGSAMPLEGIVDVRVVTKPKRVMKLASRAAGEADFSDDEDDEGVDGGAAGAGGGSAGAAALGNDEEHLWEYIDEPTCTIEVDQGDRSLTINAHNERTRDTWQRELKAWTKIRKVKVDEGTFAAFGASAEFRMFNQVTEKGKASAKR